MMNHVLQNFSCESNALMALLVLTYVHFGMTIELLRPGLFKIPHSLRTVHLAVQWCPLSQKSQLKKGEKVFLKRLQLLLFTRLSAETSSQVIISLKQFSAAYLAID